MVPFNFGPAQWIVYGAQRPGYPSKRVDADAVNQWIQFMKSAGILRVCCLLPDEQLEYYSLDLVAAYRQAFGDRNVCHAKVTDYHLCDAQVLNERILPFLRESERLRMPVVVHCSGGSGRTGHVLAAWLVRDRGLTVRRALSAVRDAGRNPEEAVQCEKATYEELEALLIGADAGTAP